MTVLHENDYNDKCGGIPREWMTEAHKLESSTGDYFRNSSIDVNVRPATSGGPRVGYQWRGRFLVTTKPIYFNGRGDFPTRHKKVFRRYFKSERLVEYIDRQPVFDHRDIYLKVINWIDNTVKPAISKLRHASYLLALHRDSGLIPDAVSKRHGNLLKERYSKQDVNRRGEPVDRYYVDYADDDTRHTIHTLAINYIRLYATCPKCGSKGFIESILGWNCTNCDYAVYDINDYFEFPVNADKKEA